MRSIPLMGPNGVMGFIPTGAIDVATQLLTFEVVFGFSKTTSVLLRIGLDELELQARRANPRGAAADLRQWVIERARHQFATEHPGLDARRIPHNATYWVLTPGPNREPFL